MSVDLRIKREFFFNVFQAAYIAASGSNVQFPRKLLFYGIFVATYVCARFAHRAILVTQTKSNWLTTNTVQYYNPPVFME